MKTEKIKINPRWKKSKEEIWKERFEDLEDVTLSRNVNLRKRNRAWIYAAAAAVAILVMLPSIAYLYTVNVYVPRGEHLSVVLPDGSTVKLNADTRVGYKPLWWRLSREVELEGEAFFEVAKGGSFKVYSGDATVTVLGTSFNIFARNNDYNVTCLTGRVKVAKQEQSVILSPGMNAVFENNSLAAGTDTDSDLSIGWTTNRFVFTGVPLRKVIEEVERQYDIEVITNEVKPEYIYSGNFSRTDTPSEVLQIIGRPFGLNLEIK